MVNEGTSARGKIRHLYAHVPFCPRVCPYCSFHVMTAKRGAVEQLVRRLVAELETVAAELELETIFLGGGTPTALSTGMLREVIQRLARIPRHGPAHEFACECNPSTLPAAKAEMMRSLGVNRLSIGAQSFDPETLRALGRTHSTTAIRECVHTARGAGFANINLDLIFGVPGQSLASWTSTLEEAVDLQPQHISCYGLTYEEDTEFFRRRARGGMRGDDAIEREMFDLADRALTAAGFSHYEISNYARPGFESAHNLAYWRGRDYRGIGPSAVSTLHGKRITNGRFDGCGWGVESVEELSMETLAAERMALGLRTSEGVSEGDFAERFGWRPRERWAREIGEMVGGGLMTDGGVFRLTPRGREVADEVASRFV